jgi:hypothetical protein
MKIKVSDNNMKNNIKGKNILFISDDFNSSIKEYDNFKPLKELVEDNNYNLFLANRFDKINNKIKYDAVFIDYGFIDNCFNTLEYCLKKIEDFHKTGVKLVWCGGLPTKYNNDAKITFPKLKYLHNLPFCSTAYDDVIFTLDKIFERRK